MRAIKIAALAGTSLLAMTAYAHSAAAVGNFVISAFLAAGAGAALPVASAAAIGGFVVNAVAIGASLLVSAFAPRPSIKPQEYKNVFEDSANQSEIRAVGRVRVGGLKAFGNTFDVDRYRLICHAKGPWTATEEHYLGGREVTVEPDGAVSSPPWSKPGGSYVFVNAKDGDGTETAWSDLVSTFPDLWTSAHRVRGIAQSLVKYVSPGLTDEKFLKLYQQGEPPYERVGRAEAVFDPRESGQDADTPTTWVWDDNGILCAAHILRAYPSLASSDLDYDDIALEATKAEASTTTLTDTEERSRCWGFWPSENPRGDVIEQVLRSIGAEIVPTDDNTYTIRLVDDVRTPEITFTERHIIDLQWRSGPESVERPNVCRVKYYSPERNFEMAEIDLTGIAWARIDDEIDRVGEQFYDVELPFCPSASQAQRIARRLFALARADAGIVKTNFAGLAAWGLTVADIELPDLDVTETCAIGTPRVNDDEGMVEIPFVVWPTLEAWDPATMEAAAPEAIPDLQYPSELDTPATPAEYALVEYPDTTRETRIRFVAVADGTVVEATYRTYAGTEPNAWASMTEVALTHAYVAGDLEGLQTDFRVRFFNSEDEGSYWSDSLEVPAIALDNTACAAPVLSHVAGVYTVPAPAELRAAAVKLESRESFGGGGDFGDWTEVDTQPVSPWLGYEETHALTPPLNELTEVRAFVLTSDGTASPASNVITIDNPGP